MIEPWILTKLEKIKNASPIILRDPQRMIRSGAWAVDGWAEEHGYTVLFCTGNLALREMVEHVRTDPTARILLVDRSRVDAKTLLFYPDLDAQAARKQKLDLSLRDFLMEQTGDSTWPHLVNDRNLSRLILGNLEGTLEAHRQLRSIDRGRFSDTDLYKIILGAALGINPFTKLTPSQVRRLCIEQHDILDELNRVLPKDIQKILQDLIKSAPKPFCWLLERDPDAILRAFTLAALLRQHELDYGLLLTNFDPSLHEFRNIDAHFLDGAMKDQLAADPERVLADVQKVEDFIKEDPQRLALLMRDQLKLDAPIKAAEVLKRERLSGLVRTLALASLLMDLISTRNLLRHQNTLAELEKQELDALIPALRRPTEQWTQLLNAYRRAVRLHEITNLLAKHMKDLKVTSAETLDFAFFDNLWNRDKINRLDFYTSDLDRMLRVGDMLPVPHTRLWPEFEARWTNARTEFKATATAVEAALKGANRLFQDVYLKNYANWIRHPESPVVFTHQFLPRMLKAHWDPKSGRKAVVLVFDGLRTDAWDEFVRPVLEERYAVLESRPGSAILPTETQLSRKAISAGMLPVDFPSKNPRELDLLTAWLKNVMRIQPRFEVIKDDDTVASGMTVRYSSPELEYIVFNFTDENLHHNAQDLAFIYTSTVREIIRQDVRSVLRELPADALVFITSDHGFTPMPSSPLEINDDVASDEKNVKYLSVRASGIPDEKIAKKSVQFNAADFRIPLPAQVHRILFPRPGYYFQRAGGRFEPDRYSHGGLSMAECMIPMVVMSAPKTGMGLLTLESVQQVGSVSEGEPLEIEIRLRANKLGETQTIALSFSQSELPERKEIFSGSQRSYRVQWQPKLSEITPEDRERGYVQMPVTVILTYRKNEQLYRSSRTTDVRIKLDPSRLRRRIDSKLDLMMGKLPKELKS